MDEAAIHAREHQPQIALLDIAVGDVISLDAISQLMIVQPGVRLIFVTAFAHDRYIERALDQNAYGYVTKREPLAVLVEAIRAVACGRRYYSGEVRERLAAQSVAPRRSGEVRTRGSLLTPRQLQVLLEIASGRSKKEIADDLSVSVKTIEAHSESIMDLLDIRDRVGLTRWAIREGLLTP
jgi:DNA-binding NarL/FixJ family response regulator